MSHKGKIYGLVGVIGGGKTYRAEQLMVDAACSERTVLVGDFSEGIRQTLMNIFTGKGAAIQLDGAVYAQWKEMPQTIFVPTSGNSVLPDVVQVTGRQFLQRTGEFLKTLGGIEIWANYTMHEVLNAWERLPEEKQEECDIIFGSVRFPYEAEKIFRIANLTGKEVCIEFCDFKSKRYELNDHESEKFARFFLEKGCKHGDIITGLVKNQVVHGAF